MKKIAAFLLTLAVLSLAACQSRDGTPLESSEPAPAESAAPSETEPIFSEPVSDPVPTEEPTPEPISSMPEEPDGKVLIAYFSLGRNADYPEGVDASTSASLTIKGGELIGTTEYVAELIQERMGGDLYQIKTTEPYSTDFDTVIDQNHAEMDAGTLPELAESGLDVSQYDTVFIGYPIWATKAPQAIYSFLGQHDLSGKTVVPFCTHDGYGSGSSYRDIAAALPGAAVLEGLAIEAPDVPGAADTVGKWLEGIGLAQTDGTAIKITVGDTMLDGVLYDIALADEIKQYFPLTISMTGYGGREYYGGVDFYPENLAGGQRSFENGHITYCEAHHNMAVFYAQTDHPDLSVDVIPIGKVTSDLAVFEELPGNVDVTFALAE